MTRHFRPGTAVEHAGQSWRIQQILGSDSLLLANGTGQIMAVNPVELLQAALPLSDGSKGAVLLDERRVSEEEWAEATLRRDLLVGLFRKPDRNLADVDRVAAKLGLKRRRTLSLLQRLETHGSEPAVFIARRRASRGTRLSPALEALITQAIEQHYAKPNRPSVLSLTREIDARCIAANLTPPSYKAVSARLGMHNQEWLMRRREGRGKANKLRLLTGAHPGATAPWERVQIDSTPCDIRLVREEDRAVIGRPTVTFALDIYSRAILGMSVSLEAASTVTVATCLAHACLPKNEWLARRDLQRLEWPFWGKPALLEYDQGPENEARGIQRGMRLHGIASKVRPVGRPEMHGMIERLIGTMMQQIHERRGTTFSNVIERGNVDPAETACLTLPELERVLALTVANYNHSVHEATGERPIERYLTWYRQPGLTDVERMPAHVPAERFLLDFLPYETRALRRGGFRLFRADYSSRDLLPMWQRDHDGRERRIVVYDPRSLATVWIMDGQSGEYISVPYRTPHPDMTLAESTEARRRLHQLKAADRTERRLFDNLDEIRRIEANAKTVTTRMKAERNRQGRRSAKEKAVRRMHLEDHVTSLSSSSNTDIVEPSRAETIREALSFEPFADVERL